MSTIKLIFINAKSYVYVNIMTIHMTFFAISAFLGIKHLGSEESSTYIIVLSISTIIAYLFLLIDIFRFKYIYLSNLFFLTVPLLVFISYLVGSSFGEFANKTILIYFVLVVPSMLSGYLYARDKNTNQLVKGFIIVSFIIFLGLLKSLSELLQSSVIDLLTVFGGGQYQALSYFAAFGYSTYLAYLLFYTNEKSRIYSLLSICLFSVFLVSIFLSGGRGGLIVIVFSSIIFFYLKFGFKKFIVFFIFILAIFFALYQLTNVMQFENKERILESIDRLFSFISGGGIDMTQSSNRDEFYNKAIELISQKLLLGYGIFGYINYAGDFYSHNLFLDFLLQGGIVYLICWILFIFCFLFKLVQILKFCPNEKIILVPVISSFTLLLFSGSYLQESLFWFSLSYVFNYKINNERETN